MVAFLLPTATAVTHSLLRGLYVRHPLDESESGAVLATYDAILLRFIVFVMGVHERCSPLCLACCTAARGLFRSFR